MIAIDYIKEMKKNVGSNVSTFKELLETSSHINELGVIVNYFNTIKIKESGNLIHLKYDTKEMFKKNWDSFYESVRGLVIDWVSEEIVLYPFDKFYELDEHRSTELGKVKIKWKEEGTAEVSEKIDGSLMISRYYNNLNFTVSSGSFKGYHVDCANKLIDEDNEIKRFLKDHSNCTVMFEMKVKELPQHIKYEEDSLTIIGMRNMNTFELLSLDEIRNLAENYKVEVVKSFNLSIEDMLKEIEDIDSIIEGYIVRIGNLLVKFKTKNFIMANRFKGEPSRNFNVFIDAINEGREKSIGQLVSNDYKESYEVGIDLLSSYINKKESKFNKMIDELDITLDNNDFAKEAQIKFPLYVKELMSLKLKRYKKFSKEDEKYLKKFSSELTCVSHFKYAELNNISKDDVLKSLESGEIKYLKKFDDTYNNETVYIIPKWQWLDKENILNVI
jgi:hypothetical protein